MMTAESALTSKRRFAQNVLPWLIALSAFAGYLCTLSPWLTVNSASLTAKVAGWDWQPTWLQPALFVATLPFRTLPASWVPLALNATTALCGALTLGLLARSVSLLPHDRFVEQERLANNEHSLLLVAGSWVPSLLAAFSCGLQLSFWENAISASGEIFDLLLFAAIIWCLLEHRLKKKQVWLDGAAVLSGVAMANSWLMVCYLPVLIAVVVVKLVKLEFRPLETPDFLLFVPKRLLLRFSLLTLGGSSLLLLLPVVQALTPDSPLTFWQALHTQAAAYKNGFQSIFDQLLRHHRMEGVLLAMSSLLPILVMSIRSRTFSISDRTDFGLSALFLLASHAGLLILCLCIAFDPGFSPREITRNLGLALPLLSLYYLAALSVGYYSGFFLLLFGSSPPSEQASSSEVFPPSPIRRALQRLFRWAVPKFIYVLPVVAMMGLLYKNLPYIQAMDRPHLREYGHLIAQSLPPEGAAVLSAERLPLLVLQATLDSEAKSDRFVPVNMQLLGSPLYEEYLRRKFPQRWPDPPGRISTAPQSSTTNALKSPAEQVQLVSRLAQTGRLFCLHPGCGILFELFYSEPRGLVYELKSYPTNALNTPLLAPETLTNYEALWTRATKTVLDPLQALIAAFEVPRQLRNELMNFAHLEMPAPPQTKVVARLYTRALNAWGVTLQRNGLLREATPYFKRARSLNPRNLAAGINFQCNSNVIAGTLTVTQASSFKEQLDRYHNVTEFVVENGPVDDPTFCFQLGVAFAEERMFRQASHEFERVKALMSGDISVSPTPGETSNPEDARAKVLSLLREIRAGSSLQPLAPAAEEEIAFLEAEPWFDALQATHRQLRTTPNDISALLNESTIFMRLGSYSNAVPPLTRILALTNSPVALYNRALAYQCMSNLDAAQTDYLELRQLWTNDCRVDYGLGEISYSRKDTNAAIGYYESYLAKTKAATEQAKLVAARLKALRQGSH